MFDTPELEKNPDIGWVRRNSANSKERFHRFFILRAVKGQLTLNEDDLVLRAIEMEREKLVRPLILQGVRIIVTED